MGGFKYDVAFSFLAEDEHLVDEVRRLLPESVAVFFYPDRQRELVGADGVQEFTNAFAAESRTVVVFCRDTWGGTRWTAVEQAAIRTRLFTEGPEFLTVVNLGTSPPNWFPNTRIWGDFARLKVEGCAAVIQERIRLAGGVVREESVAELNARLNSEKNAALQRAAFLESEAGVAEFRNQWGILADGLRRHAEAIQARHSGTGDQVLLFKDGFSVVATMVLQYRNSLRYSRLIVAEWSGRPDVGGMFHGPKKELAAYRFEFDQPSPGDFVWRAEAGGRAFSSAQLADHSCTLLLNRIRASIGSGC